MINLILLSGDGNFLIEFVHTVSLVFSQKPHDFNCWKQP